MQKTDSQSILPITIQDQMAGMRITSPATSSEEPLSINVNSTSHKAGKESLHSSIVEVAAKDEQSPKPLVSSKFTPIENRPHVYVQKTAESIF